MTRPSAEPVTHPDTGRRRGAGESLGDALAAARLACLERFAAAWNARDVEALMACMADDCAFQASAGPDADGLRHEGPAAVRAAYEAVFEQFPKAAWTRASHRLMGDHGISSWRFVGTDRRGVAIEVLGCDLFTFEGERIALKDSYRKSRTG